jgi:sugar/nucleoside kinase (ribokinase family)
LPTYDAIIAGHLCLDLIPDLSATTLDQFQKSFLPGRLTQVGSVALSTGGPVSNVGLALHKLGVATRLMGKVGDDLFGHAILQLVRAIDPELAGGMVIDPSASSSYTIVVNPPGLDRFFLHCPGANDTFGAEDVRYDDLQAARLLHFGYPPLMARMFADGGQELAQILQRAKATGITTSLDMAMPDPAAPSGQADWATILRLALPHVDLFLPSIEETLFMLRQPLFHELDQASPNHDILPLITPELLSSLSQELMALGARVVGLKLGYRGLYLRTAGRAAMASLGRARPSNPDRWANHELWAPCFQANFVGAAGSGDATIAGFLAALLRDLSPAAAVTMAVAVGACNVEAADTLSGIRTWSQTEERIAAGWPRHPLTLDAPGWHPDPHHGLWSRHPSAT